LTHVAIQINLENCEDVLFIEYWEYFSEKTEILDKSKKNNFLSSGSSKQPKPRNDELLYYYINKDGARITIIKKDKIKYLFDQKNPKTIFFGENQREIFNDNYIHNLVTEIIA
jgi:hypothetical protein